MRDRSELHNYQSKAIDHIKVNPRSMLWLDLGLGKTASALTAATDLMNSMQVYGVLVLGPLRVCQTVWAKEAKVWHHTKHLKFSLIHGKEHHRKWALAKHANVYLLNYEGVPWAVDAFINQYLARGIPLPFNMVVFDEITKLKSTRTHEGGAWGRSLQKILPYIPWRVGLTATPAPNGLQDLFGQYLVLDDGERLGTSYTNFESAYFQQADRGGYKYTITDLGEQFIQARVSDITLQMDADDYLELPPNMDNIIEVVLPDKLQAQYDKLEKEMFVELDSGFKLDVENAAILSGKCRQFANGAIYTNPEDRTLWDEVHNHKLDALVEVIEELNGDPLLLGYQFKHDADRIKKRFDKEKIKYVHFDSKIRGTEAQELEIAWNNGEYPVMLGHGQSIGHGLNFQYGCANVGWFGLPFSSETYRQFNGRVKKRQGQKRPTTVHKFLTANTVDLLVDAALDYKTQSEESIRAAVDSYRTNKLGV